MKIPEVRRTPEVSAAAVRLRPAEIARRFRRLLPLALSTYLPAFAAILGLAFVCHSAEIPLSNLTRDAVEILKAPAYCGWVSNIGVLIWSSAAVACLFSAVVVLKAQGDRERAAFLVATGVLTSWLVLDDLLLLHDVVFPSALGVCQRYVMVAYVAIASLYLFRFRRVILESEYPMLFVALAFFALSVFSDVVQSRVKFWWHHHVEDGCKLMGILGWTVYATRLAFRSVFTALPIREFAGGPAPESAMSEPAVPDSDRGIPLAVAGGASRPGVMPVRRP